MFFFNFVSTPHSKRTHNRQDSGARKQQVIVHSIRRIVLHRPNCPCNFT